MSKYEDYWIKRNEKTFLQGEKNALDFSKSLKSNYNEAISKIEDEINIFYGKYATISQLDINEVKKLLNKTELKSFKQYINELMKYGKEHDFPKPYTNQLKLLSLKSRISRLEELKVKMQFQVEKLNNNITSQTKNFLETEYKEGYYKTIFNVQQFLHFSSSFTNLNIKAIEKAVATKYMTENYSQVLWRNKNSLLNILNQQIPQGIILGQNPNKVASIASKKLETNYKSTVRLIRTEYNLILNDASAQGYKECGIDKYQLLATLDSRTSYICQEMDGKIFEVSKKEVGINYPPFHPNCRTTTIPYFEPDEYDIDIERIAKDNKGKNYYVPGNLTYKQWQEGLNMHNNTLRYKNK